MYKHLLVFYLIAHMSCTISMEQPIIKNTNLVEINYWRRASAFIEAFMYGKFQKVPLAKSTLQYLRFGSLNTSGGVYRGESTESAQELVQEFKKPLDTHLNENLKTFLLKTPLDQLTQIVGPEQLDKDKPDITAALQILRLKGYYKGTDLPENFLPEDKKIFVDFRQNWENAFLKAHENLKEHEKIEALLPEVHKYKLQQPWNSFLQELKLKLEKTTINSSKTIHFQSISHVQEQLQDQ